jgi:hypothetical protein
MVRGVLDLDGYEDGETMMEMVKMRSRPVHSTHVSIEMPLGALNDRS